MPCPPILELYIARKEKVHVIMSGKCCFRRKLLTLHKPRLGDLWGHPNRIWLVIACEPAVLWASQISYRASLLQHRFRLLFDKTGKGSPCLMAQNHVPAPVSGSPVGIRKEHTGLIEWDSSPVHLTWTSTTYMHFGVCYRFFRSVRSRYFFQEDP